jgi:hypothetical protein
MIFVTRRACLSGGIQWAYHGIDFMSRPISAVGGPRLASSKSWKYPNGIKNVVRGVFGRPAAPQGQLAFAA